MPREKAATCIQQLQRWGYEVLVGRTLGSGSATYFSGTDEERRSELQAMLDAPEVKAILCGRGGYGTGRIIEQLDFTAFRKHPKWIIGFSDITVLHAHIYRNFGISTLHAPMAAAFNDGGYRNRYVQSLRHQLEGRHLQYSCPAHTLNRPGTAEGPLVGGNLALLAHLVGTESDLPTRGRILFLEDVGEQLYNIDRMLTQLRRSGKLQGLRGLLVGGFTDNADTERPFGQTAFGIIASHLHPFRFPVCFDFPVSHTSRNYALKHGAPCRLTVTSNRVLLEEL